jgi:hypothetical protein
MPPEVLSGNSAEPTLATGVTEVLAQFATKIESTLSSYGVQLEIGDIASWALPIASKASLVLAWVILSMVYVALSKRNMLKREIHDHSRSTYLTFYDGWIHERRESILSLEREFWSKSSAYVGIINKAVKKTTPDNVVVDLRIYSEVILNIFRAYAIDNVTNDAQQESNEIIKTWRLYVRNTYIWIFIRPPSYSRQTGELLQPDSKIRWGSQLQVWSSQDITFCQLEYLIIPTLHYNKVKEALDEIAKEDGKNIKSIHWWNGKSSTSHSKSDKGNILKFLNEVCINNGSYSNEVINRIFGKLFTNKDLSEDDIKKILIEKKRLLHIIHIIRYEVRGWYIEDGANRWRQGEKRTGSYESDIS